ERLIQPLWRQVYLHNLSLMSGFIEFRLYDKTTEPIPVHTYQFVNNRLPSRCLNYPAEFDTVYLDQNNASFLLRTDTIPQTFQKAKLVPMVERMPFLDVLTFLKDLAPSLGGSVGGYGYPDSVRNLVLHTQDKVAPMICYESEYGDYVRQFVKKGARLMTIVTNDGWWGESSGHIQHAHFSTLRAIETRRDIARSANTGTSLFTDNRGYIHQDTEFWVPTQIDRKLSLYDGQTFYVQHGDYLGDIVAGLSLLLLLLILIRNARIGRIMRKS
ncbi:MAG: apolipoprotein N-acyltransferase, partial [Bacteroidota bacterium]